MLLRILNGYVKTVDLTNNLTSLETEEIQVEYKGLKDRYNIIHYLPVSFKDGKQKY